MLTTAGTQQPGDQMNERIDLPADAIAAVQSGRMIDAIKITREQRGVGLKEAKEAVDAYRRHHPGGLARQPINEAIRWAPAAWVAVLALIACGAYWLTR